MMALNKFCLEVDPCAFQNAQLKSQLRARKRATSTSIIDEFVKLKYKCPLAILFGLQAGMYVMLSQLQLEHDLANTTGAITSKEWQPDSTRNELPNKQRETLSMFAKSLQMLHGQFELLV